MRDGEHAAITLVTAGVVFVVTATEPVSRDLEPRRAALPRPTQPAGREPASALRQDPTPAAR